MSQQTSAAQYNKMLETPIPKLVISLSIPSIISMMVTNIYNVVDTAFVGKLGTSASGAVGIVFGFMAILQAIGFTFGQGAGSIISRKLGQKDESGASRIATTAVFYAFVLAAVTAIICGIFLTPIVYALGSTDTIAPYAKTYITFILLTAPFMVTSYTLNNILRFEGKPLFGMIGLMSGAFLNIAGDALFMFGLHMGIAGAGLSTALSQVVGFFVLLSAFLRGKTQCKLAPKHLIIQVKEFGDIFATGFPSFLRQGLNSITTIMLNTRAAFYGDAAVAAMSITARLFFFIMSVALGVGQGFQPVSGFNYGAKRYDRLKSAYRFAFLLGEGLMLVLGGVLFFKAPFFIGLLRDDPEVIVIATRALHLQCIGVLCLPFCMVTEMTMQSTGQKLAATFLSAMRNGLIFIPCLVILTSLRGLSGIQEAQPLSYLLGVIPSAWIAVRFFRRLEKEPEKE